MSKEAMKWAEDQKLPDVTLMAVLRAVSWHADKGTGECRASQDAIAAQASVKNRVVKYSLAVLERLEMITRKPRSKGKYGRATDLVTLSLNRNFDVSKATIKALRKAVRTPLQGAHGAGCKKFSKVHTVPLQGAHGAREYNQDYQVPYQEEKLPTDSYGRGGTDTHATCDAGACETSSPDRDNPPTGQLIRFPARGAL